MNSKLKKTVISLHISVILYIIICVILLIPQLSYMIPLRVVTAIIGFIFAGFVEVVVMYLKKGKRWAWIAAIVINIFYIPSLFIILGIIGLVGLFNKEVMKEFSK